MNIYQFIISSIFSYQKNMFKDIQQQQQQKGNLKVHHNLPKILMSMAINKLLNMKRLELSVLLQK